MDESYTGWNPPTSPKFHPVATTVKVPRCTLRTMGHKAKTEARVFKAPGRLAKLRKAAKMSQQQIADATGMTKASVSRIENGEQNYDAEFLWLAARALNCQVWELFWEGPKPDALADALIEVIDKHRT